MNDWIKVEQESIASTIFHLILYVIKVLFHCYPNPDEPFTTKCCTWYSSLAVMACARVCRDIMARNEITMKWIFHQISVVLQKTLVKWVPALKWWHPNVETEWWIVKQTAADLDNITMIWFIFSQVRAHISLWTVMCQTKFGLCFFIIHFSDCASCLQFSCFRI